MDFEPKRRFRKLRSVINVTPENRIRFAEWIRNWSRETTRKRVERDVNGAVKEAIRCGISDQEIILETNKLIRRMKRRSRTSKSCGV
jgi:hypothetical protein